MKTMKKALAMLLTLVMVLGMVPVSVFAADGGTNASQPFPTSVIGNGHYRIPAFITTSNGTLVAAADARWHSWDTTDDNGDIDTIVSVSKDNGANWTYTFANYIDNGDTTDYGAATFIDPALAYDGETIYMIVDLYPGQSGETNCTGSSKTGTGYDSNGNLLLGTSATAAESALSYYLSDGKILDASGNDQGYTVDAWFNVTDSNGNSCGNLFNYDNTCGFHPLLTSHLYLTKSADNGATWSEPVMLNSQVKTSDDTYYLVSPGRGIVTSDGTIIFGAYDNSGQASLIYSTDGENWSRSDNSGFTSSENEIVELSNGTLRMFYRYGYSSSGKVKYVDITENSDGSYSFGSPVSTSASFNGNVNISAISYSKTYNGKQVIFVSCPADTSGQWLRYNGKIYTFTFDGTDMELVSTYDVDSSSSTDAFSYSCLTELSDGSIGMLYEKGDAGNITYLNVKPEEISDLTFDSETEDDDEEEEEKPEETETNVTVADESITVESAEEVTEIAGLTDFMAFDVTLTKDGASYTDAATITLPLNGKYAEDVELWGFVLEADGTVTYVKENVVRDNENDTVTFTAPHFSTVGSTPALTDAGDVTITDTVDVRIPVGGESETYTVEGVYVTSLSDLNTTVASATLGGQQGSEATVTYTETSVTCATLLDSNSTYAATDYYVLTDSGDYYPLYASRSRNGNNRYNYTWHYSTDGGASFTQCGSETRVQSSSTPSITVYTKSGTEGTDPYTTVSFKGVSVGTTTATVGTTQYNITVYEEKNITINYTANGSVVATGTLTVASDATTATLPGTVTDGTNTYTVDETTLTLTGASSYNVEVTKVDMVIATIDNTPLVGGSTTYITYNYDNTTASTTTNHAQGLPVTGLTITTGTSFDLDLADSTKTVTWGTTSDKITVDQNGTVTGVTATAGELVYVTATVDGITYAIPVTVLAGDNEGDAPRTIDMYNDLEVHCTAYYGYNDNDLVEWPEGSVFFVEHDSDTTDCIIFYAKPDEGYALTCIGASSGSAFHIIENGTTGEYGATVDDDAVDTSGTYDYLYDQLVTHVVNNPGSAALTLAQAQAICQEAVDKGVDGAFFWSRGIRGANGGTNANSSFGSECIFIAEKLPEMEKVISSVVIDNVEQEYTPGMTLGIGATINYTIYVYVPTAIDIEETYGFTPTRNNAITYSDISLVDELTGDSWTAWSNSYTTVSSFDYINASGQAITYDETTATRYAYTTSITLGAGNFLSVVKDGKVTNVADLTYNYTSEYSYGDYEGVSQAVAEVLVEVPEYVIDFGLPVEIDLDNDPLVVGDVIVAATAKYGDVYITGNRTLLYVPNTILQGTDFITLTFADGGVGSAIIGYGVRIYPATSVYYEESIINSDWATGGNRTDGTTVTYREYTLTDGVYNMTYTTSTVSGIVLQESAELGDTQLATNPADNYGYDDAYASTGTNSGYITGTSSSSTLTFTFTGTGFQLYGNSSSSSGYVTVYSQGNLNKLYMINTELSGSEDENDTTNDQETDANAGKTYYGLPFISETDLPYGTYTVMIKQTNGEDPIYLDGIRILNTINDETDGSGNIYYTDLEDKPDFYELRDYVLNAIGVENLADSDYIDSADRVGLADSVSEMAGQVYNALGDGTKAIIIDEGTTFDSNDAQDLLDNGPKNDLYLYPNQTLVFSVTTDRVMQLGLKAPTGSAAFTITVDDGTTTKTLNLNSISTSVDMFYELVGNADAETTYTVRISVTSGPLSVTLLKICDDPNAEFADLTQEAIENAMLAMYGLVDEDSSVEDEETETPVEPSEPEEETPTEPEIPEEEIPTEPETKPTEPSKPGKPGNDKPGSNRPGRPAVDNEQTEAEAVLNIVFVNLRGKEVGTATLTETGNANTRCVFSAAEIAACAPAGRYVLRFTPAVITYGSTDTIVVPVI